MVKIMDIDSLKIKKFCELSGWTESAVRHMINKGLWTDGLEYVRMPNKCLYVSIKGYEGWINRNRRKVPASFR